MTIRVRCDGCSAVMKVKDELAGAKGKCPKCKTSFVIPTAKESTAPKVITQTQEGDDNESELGTPADEAADAATQVQAPVLERPIDLPLEPTPPVPPMDDEEFDPMGTLASGSNTALPAMAAEPSEPVNKPSVADLMKEHTEKKERTTRRKEKAKSAKPSKAAELAQPDMTSGSAADALNRKYDQKRAESADAEKLMTRDERRQAEHKAAMIDFAKKGIPAVAGTLLLAYGLIWYAFSAALPPLGYVNGKVTRNGSPMAGVQVTFNPMAEPGTPRLENATQSGGFTDADGNYTLLYNKDNEGVLPGNHEVGIIGSSGLTFTLPPEMKTRKVEVGETHTFDFNL